MMTIVRFNAPLNSISPNNDMSERTFAIWFVSGSSIQTGSVSGSNILGFSIANFVGVINILMQNLASALRGSSSVRHLLYLMRIQGNFITSFLIHLQTMLLLQLIKTCTSLCQDYQLLYYLMGSMMSL
jgi:hypothetical protein